MVRDRSLSPRQKMDRKTIDRLKAFSILALLAIAIAPTLSVKIPAMEDYLDHLSRMYILVTAGTNDANPYYQVSWALYPNLAMDLIVPSLARFVSVETAGKIFFLSSQILIISGAFALELSVKRRHEISMFAALLTLPSLPFAFGFVNFEFGTGLSLWGIASWITLSRLKKYQFRVIAHIFFGCLIFLAHFFALGIYGLVIGTFELRRILELRLNPWRALAIGSTLACPVVLMLLLMVSTGATIGESYNKWWFSRKPFWLLEFLNGYSPALAAGSACALAILLFYGALKRNLLLSADGKWIAFGLLVVFIAMPFQLFGSRMADVRMIAAAFLILPAFTTLAPRARSFGYAAAVVIVPIILVNSIYVGYVWVSYQNDYKAMKTSFTLLRQKSFILVGSAPARDTTLLMDVPMWRAPTLAVYYAKAFVSSLYTVSGTHAVEVKPELHHLDLNAETETYAPPSLANLKIIAEGGNVSDAPQYVRNWQNEFDYVYLLGPHVPNALPNILVEIATERRFTLYRVRKGISSEMHQ
jgi:hypothetical protein